LTAHREDVAGEFGLLKVVVVAGGRGEEEEKGVVVD
jgi:hypothetical protein